MSSLKAFLRDNIQSYSLDEIVEHYIEWVKDDRYMILSRWKNCAEHGIKAWNFKNEVLAVKCAKRGNDVYRSRVNARFRNLCATTENLCFFDSNARGAKETRALWVTLTYNTKLCSLYEAWHNVGNEFNRFMSYVRKQFGKVSCCRVFEAFENGYPHIHCILLFERSFSAFEDSKGQFRIGEKDVFSGGWHSNVDIKAMSSLAGGLAYLKKYLLKSIDFEIADSKGLKTLALCWAYRKRAFSVSGSFRRALSDLTTSMHNSNKKTAQVSLSREVLPEEKLSVLGFVPMEVIQLAKNIWFRVLDPAQIDSVEQYLSERRWST
jgi:hypothetical protein